MWRIIRWFCGTNSGKITIGLSKVPREREGIIKAFSQYIEVEAKRVIDTLLIIGKKTSVPSNLYGTFLRFHANVYLLVKLFKYFPSTPNKTKGFRRQNLHRSSSVNTPGASVVADFGPPLLSPNAELYYPELTVR
jgi:hypothetical protein